MRFGVRSFESQIDRPRAQGTSMVFNATRNGCHLAASNLDFTLLKVNHQDAFDDEKCLESW
jgi:hypothetical protein